MEDFSSTEQSKHEEQYGVKHVLRNKNEVHDLCIVGDTICIEKNTSKIENCFPSKKSKNNMILIFFFKITNVNKIVWYVLYRFLIKF